MNPRVREVIMNPRVREVLTGILERFKSGDIPEAIALASYPRMDIPSGQWSLLNRTLMFISGTDDARGFRQWEKANRFVKKGSKAIYILVSWTVSKGLQQSSSFMPWEGI